MEYEALQKLKEKLLEIGKANLKLSKGRGIKGLAIIAKPLSHNTREEIAEELGWGTNKVSHADVVSKNATAETKEKLRTQIKGTNNSPLNNYF